MEVAMALMQTVVEDEEEQYERLVEVFKYKRVANKVRCSAQKAVCEG